MSYICQKCNHIFKTKRDLERHENKKKSCVIRMMYNCECGYSTNIKQNYEKHKNKKNPCKKIDTEIERLAKDNMKMREEMDKLKQKIDKQKRPINYNFIVNSFTNASNIEDCLSMENITEEILEKCKKLPLKDGSIYVLNTLCDIDPQIRPIHCTDTNRQNYLVRSNDSWNIDSKGATINDHLNPVISTLYTDIYKEKMQNKNVSIDDRMNLMDSMSKELISSNISKCSQNAIKVSSNKYTVKNIDNALDIDETN